MLCRHHVRCWLRHVRRWSRLWLLWARRICGQERGMWLRLRSIDFGGIFVLGFRTSSKLEHGHITLIRRRTRALPLWVSGLGRTFVSYVRFGIRAFARAPRECLHTCARLGSPRAVSAASAWVSRACIAIRWRRHHEGRAHATYARFIGCWLCSVRHIIHVFSRCPHKKKKKSATCHTTRQVERQWR